MGKRRWKSQKDPKKGGSFAFAGFERKRAVPEVFDPAIAEFRINHGVLFIIFVCSSIITFFFDLDRTDTSLRYKYNLDLYRRIQSWSFPQARQVSPKSCQPLVLGTFVGTPLQNSSHPRGAKIDQRWFIISRKLRPWQMRKERLAPSRTTRAGRLTRPCSKLQKLQTIDRCGNAFAATAVPYRIAGRPNR